jgi:hypothetical protein
LILIAVVNKAKMKSTNNVNGSAGRGSRAALNVIKSQWSFSSSPFRQGSQEMAKPKQELSPEVATRLADLAREMRQILYQGDSGQEGVPAWGTKFSRIEADCLTVSDEIGRLMIEQAVTEQGLRIPRDALQCEAETATLTGASSTVLETPAGEVHWQQPKARLTQARRDFFPSGAESGT